MFNFFRNVTNNLKEKSPFGQRLLKAAELAEEGLYEEAIDVLDIAHLRSTKPLKARVELLFGIILCDWGRNTENQEEAARLFKTACETFEELNEKYFKDVPTRSSYYFEWGNVLGEYGKRCSDSSERIECYHKSNEIYAKAAEIMTDVPQLYNNWGGMLVDLAGEEPENMDSLLVHACKLFEKGIELDSDYANIFSNWGRVFFIRAMQSQEVGLYMLAKEKFEKAIEIDPDNQTANANIGSVYHNLAMLNFEQNAPRYFEMACDRNSKAVENNPYDDCALSNLANSYWNYAKFQSDVRTIELLFEKTIECANRAIEINERNAQAYFALGSVYIERGFMEVNNGNRISLEKACLYFQKSIEYNPNLATAYVNLATVYLNLAKVGEDTEKINMLQKSYSNYKIALRFEPCNSFALNNYLVALFRFAALAEGKEKYDALDEVISFLLNEPSLQAGPWMYNVACAYLSKGDIDNGKKWLLEGEKSDSLEPRELAMNDPDMAKVKDEDWFQNIKWKGE